MNTNAYRRTKPAGAATSEEGAEGGATSSTTINEKRERNSYASTSRAAVLIDSKRYNYDDDGKSNELFTAADDGGDTSFEIDEPDDEEVIGNLLITSKPLSTNIYSTNKRIIMSQQQPSQFPTQHRLEDLKETTNEHHFTVIRLQQAATTTTTNTSSSSSTATNTFDNIDNAEEKIEAIDDDGYCEVENMSSSTCRSTIIVHGHGLIPNVAIRDDTGEQSDLSLGSDTTDSSTPTTTDIADLAGSANSCSPLIHIKRMQRQLSSQNQRSPIDQFAAQNAKLAINNGPPGLAPSFANSNNGSIADDNLSGSIATTTTEVDTDNGGLSTIASPIINYPASMTTATTNSRLRTAAATASGTTATTTPASATSAFESSQRNSSNSPAMITTVDIVTNSSISAQHPSAAFLQSDTLTRQSDAIISTPNHKRTLSASSYRSIASQHPSLSAVSVHSVHSRFYNWIRWICLFFKSSGIGEPSVYHALVVIFLEFFAWGLLTMPVISVLNQTFPDHTFLMNGLVMGIKGILSFLSAPLIGALSDIWGRKFFLLITVFFTCAPIPLMTINSWWFFAMISISGIFAVTFSVVFAYVADVTTVEERSRAYGLVSATFAASLVISPALGAALMEMYSDTLVVALATAIAVLDVFFILVAVPESLPEKVRPSSWGAPISWEQADPFAALRKVGTDHTILMQCVTVLLSYLPEAGQYSCIFVYIKLKMGFNSMEVAIFIAVVGILSISIQVTLGYLMRVFGAKRTIILGLVLEMLQLLWYGLGSQKWMMWAAGVLAALGSITYPAISAFVSIHSTPDRQGAVQGMVTGMRGLCNGLGPAMFGVIFYLFNVDLNDEHMSGNSHDIHSDSLKSEKYAKFIPGPPFVFGAFMVILAILVAIFIPEGRSDIGGLNRAPSEKKRISLDVQYEIETGHKATGPLAPLMRSDSLAQL